MRIFTSIAVLILGALFAPVFALAQTAVDPADGEAFFGLIAKAVAAGDWRWVAVLAVIGATFLVRTYGSKLPKIGHLFASKRGGAAIACFMALLSALAPALAGQVPWTMAILSNAIMMSAGAIGGWVGVRRLIWGDAIDGVDAAAGKVVIPIPLTTPISTLGSELDQPVKR
jgi:hypothetical protein